jgi:DNA-binding phage protein
VCARTENEFIELLRTIQARSGASVPRLAAEAGVPRSQLYSLLRRGRLPTKPEQVEAVIKAAGLTEEQVAQVMHLWTTLRALGSPGPARDYAVLYEADENQSERLHSQTEIVRMISLAAGAEPVPWITHSDEQLDQEQVRWLLRSSVRARAKALADNAEQLLPESHTWLSASAGV